MKMMKMIRFGFWFEILTLLGLGWQWKNNATKMKFETWFLLPIRENKYACNFNQSI